MIDLPWLKEEVEAEGKYLILHIPLSSSLDKYQQSSLIKNIIRDAVRDYGPFDRLTQCNNRLTNTLEITLER